MGFRNIIKAFKSDKKAVKTKKDHKNEFSSKKTILFVCPNNMAISPIAEAIFNQKVTSINALSAGTFLKSGEKIPQETISVCEDNNIELSHHLTMGYKDIPKDDIDLVLTSTVQIRNFLKEDLMYRNLAVFTIKEYLGKSNDLNIQSPVPGDMSSYEACFSQVSGAIDEFIRNDFKKGFKSEFRMENFRYLENLLENEKEIILHSDISLDEIETESYRDGIKLDTNGMILNGNGHTIDAKGKTRIFNIKADNVELKNIQFKNAFSQESGGAIINEGTASIVECDFHSNTSKISGGAIFNGKHLEIRKCTFFENFAEGYREGYGGAIDNKGILKINNSHFANNVAEQSGGAICNIKDNLKIQNSIFNHNISRQVYKYSLGGGAIYNTSKLKIEDSTFENNFSKSTGAAITNGNQGEVVIYDSKFLTNNVWGDPSRDFNDDGGVLVNINGEVKLFRCQIFRNEVYKAVICNRGSFEIHYSKFHENKSEHCIKNIDSKNLSKLSMVDVEFIDNDIGENIILNNGKSCSLSRITFKDNSSSNNILNNRKLILMDEIKESQEGQSIINNGKIEIKDTPSEIIEKIGGNLRDIKVIRHPNEFKFDFGYLDKKIHESETKEVLLSEDITFQDYETEFYEGGIELDIDGMVIDGNGKTIDAAKSSRIFTVTGDNITLKNIVFKNGYVERGIVDCFNNGGGAIRINSNCRLTINDCTFANHRCEENGGAIYNRGNLTIDSSKFTNIRLNNPKFFGGLGVVIYNDGTLNIASSEFSNSTPDDTASETIFNNDEAKLDIFKSTFQALGKQITNKGLLTVEESSFFHCAETIINEGKSTFRKSIFSKNKQAIVNKGEAMVKDSSFTNNSIYSIMDYIKKDEFKNGGASIYNDGDMDICSCTFSNNTASGDSFYINAGGGAISNTGNLNVYDSTFSGNVFNSNQSRIYGHGGGAISNKGNLNIKNSLFSDNSSNCYGGAITSSSKLSILWGDFSNNSSQMNGGAIYANKDTFKMEATTFSNNSPKDIEFRK